jgi:hypothetical protein
MDLVTAADQFLEEGAEREQMSECRRCVRQDSCHRYHVFSVGVSIVRLTLSRVNIAASAPLAPKDAWCQHHPQLVPLATDR